MQTDKYDRELIDTIVKWKPKLVEQVKSIENECGFPTVIYRSPSRLIKECEDAYDCGCVIAALTLVLTIPDVCSRLDGTEYRIWSARYLQLKKNAHRRKRKKRLQKVLNASRVKAYSRQQIYINSDAQ